MFDKPAHIISWHWSSTMGAVLKEFYCTYGLRMAQENYGKCKKRWTESELGPQKVT